MTETTDDLATRLAALEGASGKRAGGKRPSATAALLGILGSAGGGGLDKFRIKIWDKATGMIVYDNLMGADDGADPTTVVTHGSIRIQKG